MENILSSTLLEATYEAALDGVGHAILFLAITIVAIEWFSLLLQSKAIQNESALLRIRRVLIASYVAYAVTWMTCSLLEAFEVGVEIVTAVADFSVVPPLF